MFSSRGIAVDSFARIDGDCPITCDVIAGEAELAFGDYTHAVHLVIDDNGLRKLSTVVTDALTKLSLSDPEPDDHQ